ncbi:MAG: recombination regulator RecX [Clostridia bacterium]|nr:recombination regulator RecX [Clostridia bacterium]
MEITSVERSKKNKDMLWVYIDGKYSFSVAEEDYLSLNLYENRELTTDEVDNIKNNISFRTAKSTAIKFLSLKMRSGKEVFNKLILEGFDTEAAESVVEELKAIGYINDELYAQKYIFDRSKLKPKAKKLIKLELVSKGIGEDIADNVLGNWEVDEETVAESLVKRKFGKYNFNDEKIIRKVYAFLQHRGFDYEIINLVVKNIKQEF